MSDDAATLEEAQQSVILTDRWMQPAMFDHAVQQALIYHPARNKWVPAGRRSGKTETVKRVAVSELIVDRSFPARIGIGAPTYARVKEIYFADLERLIPKSWIKNKWESFSQLGFETHWGAVIRLLGMNNPEVIEGPPWDFFFADEFADYPKNCYEEKIGPAMDTAGRLGKFWALGVPDETGSNQTEYEKYWEIGLRWPEQSDHCSFWWPSKDILDPEELAKRAATMDEIRFRQEYEGRFIRSGGKAFPTFNIDTHVDESYAEYCSFLPIDHSLDFGVRPTCSLVGQSYKNQVWILDEITLEDGSTDVVGNAFLERAAQQGWLLSQGVRVYGDAAGRTPGQNIGTSDYEILSNIYRNLPVRFLNLIKNPEIKDTVNAVRYSLRDTTGLVHLYIHPRCKGLIEDMKSAPWPDDLSKFHRLAALRYYLYTLYRDKNNRGGVTPGRASLTADQQRSAKYTRKG